MNNQKYSEGSRAQAPGFEVAFTLGPSALARGWACVIGAAGMGTCLVLPLAVSWRGIAFVAVLLATLRAACVVGCASGGSPRGVEVGQDGRVRIQDGEAEAEVGELCAGTLVLTRLVVLRYRTGRRRQSRTLFVAPDALGDDDFRRLRMLLRAG
jgi:hypothetical protein